MDTQEFRTAGHQLIDWVADYLEHAERYPVLPQVRPGDLRRRLPEEPPEQAESMQRILEDFERLVLPAVTHWNHPRFFAYFPANNSGPSILGELLSAALGVNGMLWQSCPAATELELLVMEWLRKLLGLPAGFSGVLQDSASTASLCALLCAREAATGHAFNLRGPAALEPGRPLRLYATGEAHSSIEKGARIAGFGSEQLVRVGVDPELAMDPADLERRIVADRRAGLIPCAICATLGTTSSTAFDPLGPIGRIARAHGLWLHVDAAMAGSAAILPEMRWMLEGIEAADSFVTNPHKWLLVNFDCSAYFTRRPEVLVRSLSIAPEYLRTAHDAAAPNLRDWGVPLGRRFRALKLWFVLRSYGARRLRQMLRHHLELARRFAGLVDSTAGFERLAPVRLQTVCFRYHPPGRDEEQLRAINQRLLDAVNRTGRVLLTHTSLQGRFCLRMSIGQRATRLEDVLEAFELLVQHAPGCAQAV